MNTNEIKNMSSDQALRYIEGIIKTDCWDSKTKIQKIRKFYSKRREWELPKIVEIKQPEFIEQLIAL